MEFSAQLLDDEKCVGGAGPIVKHRGVNRATGELETLYDVVVGCDMVEVVTGLEGLTEDHVAVRVVCQHDVVVAVVRADREAANAVGVELVDGINGKEEFFGALGRELTSDVEEGVIGGRLGLGGAGALS